MMPSTPRLLRHATVTPGAGVTNVTPAPSIRQIVCENIRIACIRNEVRRKQLASMLGIGYAATAGIWHGTRNMSIEDLWTIAKAFEIPVHRFFDAHDVDDWDWMWDDRRRTEARQAVIRSLHELAEQLEDYSNTENGRIPGTHAKTPTPSDSGPRAYRCVLCSRQFESGENTETALKLAARHVRVTHQRYASEEPDLLEVQGMSAAQLEDYSEKETHNG